jgi:hypothetical protein
MNIWLIWFNSYHEKARTTDNNGSGFNFISDSDSNFDFPYEIKFKFGSETMDMLEKDKKDFVA